MSSDKEVQIKTVRNGWLVFVGGIKCGVDNAPYAFNNWDDLVDFLVGLEELDPNE